MFQLTKSTIIHDLVGIVNYYMTLNRLNILMSKYFLPLMYLRSRCNFVAKDETQLWTVGEGFVSSSSAEVRMDLWKWKECEEST